MLCVFFSTVRKILSLFPLYNVNLCGERNGVEKMHVKTERESLMLLMGSIDGRMDRVMQCIREIKTETLLQLLVSFLSQKIKKVE